MQLEIDKKTNMKYRPDTSDSFVLKEMKDYEQVLQNCKDAIVMDMGANIGAFTNAALNNGAKQVICFEPEPSNYEVLTQQPFDPNKIIFVNAAISNKNDKMDLYINTKKMGTITPTLRPVRGRKKVSVDVLEFYSQIEKYKPTIIKCDCEGGEYEMDWSLLPKEVEYMAIEIHVMGFETKAPALLEWFENNFEILYAKDDIFFKKPNTWFRCGKRKNN